MLKMSRSHRGRAALAVLAASMMTLTGCNSAVQAQNASSAAATPVKGGTVTAVLTADIQPKVIFAPRAGNSPWISNVFETLTRRDAEQKPQPLLATKWKIADDGLSIAIDLREGVTFHTGRPMTAADVKFSFETAADPAQAAQFGFVAQQFSSIEIQDDHSLTIHFKAPLSNIFDFFEGTPIIDSQTIGGLADGSKVIGTGPYVFSKWEPGASLLLTRNDKYWNPDAAYLDSINFAVITDGTAQVSALRSNRASVAGLTATDAKSFDGNPAFKVAQAGGSIFTFGMSTTTAPFDNKQVRQAVGYAIDRKRINDQVMAGLGTTTDLFWSPDEPGLDKTLDDKYTYDPVKAKQMIQAAGATGAEVPIVLAANPLWQGVYEILQNNLQEAGLKPVARAVNVTEFDQKQTAGDMGAAFINIHGQVGLSAASLISSTPALRPTNPSRFYPEQYQKLRANLLAAVTPDDNAKALNALSTYMLDEAFTQPIMQAPGPVVVSSKVAGVDFTVTGKFLFQNAYLSE